MTDPTELELPYPGFTITAEHYRGVTTAARHFHSPHSGYNDTDCGSEYKPTPYPYQIKIQSYAAIPKNSLMQLGTFSPSHIPADYPVTTFAGTTVAGPASVWPRIFLTNDAFDIPYNTNAWVSVITPYMPVKVLCNAYHVPKLFMPCGSEGGAASNRSVGLMAVSEPTTDGKFIEVIAHDPKFLNARTLATMGAPTDGYTDINSVNVDVWLPDATAGDYPATLIRSLDPSLTNLMVVNRSATLSALSGTNCKIVYEFGIWEAIWFDC